MAYLVVTTAAILQARWWANVAVVMPKLTGHPLAVHVAFVGAALMAA